MPTRSVFVISPIGSSGSADHRRHRLTLDFIVKKAFFAPDWEVVRADEETSPDSITTQVIARIIESDLIVADLTDHNPNVFYELAVAHGYQKPVIHLMQVGQKPPFDVVDQRVIFYDLTDPESVEKARTGLRSSAKWLDENPNHARNPLSAYGRFAEISSASGGGETGEVIAEAIESLSRQISRLDSRMRRSERLTPAGLSTYASDLQASLVHLMRRRDQLIHDLQRGEPVEDALTDVEFELASVEQAMARMRLQERSDG